MSPGVAQIEYFLQPSGLSDLPPRLPLRTTPTVIGRAGDAAIRLLSPAISRRHCEFVRDPVSHRWWVRDLRSHNGTRVNGQPIRERLLQVGDVVQVGDVAFAVHSNQDALTDSFAPVDEQTIAGQPPEVDSHTMSLREVRPPNLSAAHLESLMALHRRLLDIHDPTDRMIELCAILAGDEFHGRAAVVLHLDGQGEDMVIRPQCSPQLATGESRETVYYSTTLLRAIRQRCEPTMASWSDHSFGSLEVTHVEHMRQRAAMACPLDSNEHTMTVLYIVAPAQYARGEWLALADLAAEQFRQANRAWTARQLEAENAAFQRELELAKAMQMRFIPLDAHVDGLELAIGYEPCRWVGGDYIDVLEPRPNHVVLVVADVCGKGVQAALLTASLHTMLHSASVAGMNLVTLVATLNEYLCATLTDGSFITLQCIEIDLTTGLTTCVNAGHPPALVITPHSDGATTRTMLAAANLPLGVEPMVPQSHTDQLADGELLFMYTDGLTELADESGKMLGVTGLGELMQTAHDDSSRLTTDAAPCKTLDQIREHLLEQVDAIHDGRMPLDDQTFLLARRIATNALLNSPDPQ